MPANTTAHPELWPEARSAGLVDDQTEAFITDLMAKMSLREKVGQMIQGDTTATVPEDLREYPLGSVLAGGNSAPPNYADDNVAIDVWIRTTQAYHAVALETPDAMLITADERYYRAARAAGRITLLADWS